MFAWLVFFSIIFFWAGQIVVSFSLLLVSFFVFSLALSMAYF